MLKRKLTEIKIPSVFAESTPKPYKMTECREYWKKHKRQDRYLVVNRAGLLIDGYIQYLVLLENEQKEAEVAISDYRKDYMNRKANDLSVHSVYRNELTTYIWGYHNCKSQKQTKEYIWRVPKSWSEAGWENDVKVGDNILVHTKFGVRFIKVSRIERMDTCPVHHYVNKVYRKVRKA